MAKCHLQAASNPKKHALPALRPTAVVRKKPEHGWRVRTISSIFVAASAALGYGAVPALAGATHKPVTVTFAEQPGSPPNYIQPLQPPEFFTFFNDQEFSYLIYPPLYWIGMNGQPLFNEKMSLAYPAVFTVNSKNQTVATIKLKPYKWSDGTPITSRDVEFWMNLVVANKSSWGDYVPGQFPDNVVSVEYQSSDTIQITFDRTYNHTWLLDNELVQIFPMPQHVWDKTSSNGKVGNYDETKKGAVAVLQFLNAQSKDATTYVTNPLWKVVDGPWQISEYNPATGYLVLVPNKLYGGDSTHSIDRFVELPFTSAAAEFNALRGGTIDYGYLPLSDVSPGQIRQLKSEGYSIIPWKLWGWNFWPLNFAQPDAGPIFNQLYVRQALQHLINQKGWVKFLLHGFGSPEYSNIPVAIKSPYGDAYVKEDHYPFSVAAAKELLSRNGWKVVPGGVSTCVKPGTGAGECGAGIKAGAAMNFTVEFSSGYPALKQEVVQFETEAEEAGIRLTLVPRPFAKVFADYFSCVGAPASACHWQIIAPTTEYLYGWYPDYYPVGAANYNTGAIFNGGQYSDPTMNKLTTAAHEESGLGALHKVEDYTATELPTLWAPGGLYQISVIKKGLHVPLPQGLESNIYPQLWTVGKAK